MSKFYRKCIWCDDGKIFHSLLCLPCYHSYVHYGSPSEISLVDNIKNMITEFKNIDLYRIEKFIKKYGVDFINDIETARTNPAWTLARLADKYGFSREYIRSVFKRIYGVSFTKYFKKKVKLYRKDIACIHDPRTKVACYKKGSSKYKGAKIEKLFLEECEKRDIPIEIPCNGEIDLKVNGYFVDVKSCSNPTFLGVGSKIPSFRYRVSKKQRKKCSFIACYHGTEKKFFIIPIDAILRSNSIYILEKKSDCCWAKNRYWEYRNAWNLLRK